MRIAEFLASHPKVDGVYYPGLKNHRQHQKARKWFRYAGAILSFDLIESENCLAFLDRLQIIVSASNLADNRSLAIPVAKTIFYEMGMERRKAMGISETDD